MTSSVHRSCARSRLWRPLPPCSSKQQIDQRLAREGILGPQREHLAIQVGRHLDSAVALAKARRREQRGPSSGRIRLHRGELGQELRAIFVAAQLGQRRLHSPPQPEIRRRERGQLALDLEHGLEIAVAASEPDRALEDRPAAIALELRSGRAQPCERDRDVPGRVVELGQRFEGGWMIGHGLERLAERSTRLLERLRSADLVREELGGLDVERGGSARIGDRCLPGSEPAPEMGGVRRGQVRLRERVRIAATERIALGGRRQDDEARSAGLEGCEQRSRLIALTTTQQCVCAADREHHRAPRISLDGLPALHQLGEIVVATELLGELRQIVEDERLTRRERERLLQHIPRLLGRVGPGELSLAPPERDELAAHRRRAIG